MAVDLIMPRELHVNLVVRYGDRDVNLNHIAP